MRAIRGIEVKMNRGMNKGNKAIRHEGNKRYRGIAFKLLKIFAIPQYIYTSIRPFFRFSIPPYLNTSIPRRKRSLLLGFSLIELMISLITVSCITAAFAPVISKKIRTTNIVSVGSKSINCKNEDCLYCDATGNVCYICNKDCEDTEYLDIQNCNCVSCSEASGATGVCLKCKYDRKNGGGICTLSGCPKGQYVDMTTNSCQPCSAGYYQPNDNSPSTSCIPCPAGEYSSAGAAGCSACPAGKYSLQGWAECQNCSAGYYSNAGASECTQCPAGQYCSSSGCTACQDCSAGYYSNAGASSCSACTNWHAQCTECNASGCSACNSGYHVSGSGCDKNFDCSNQYYCIVGNLLITKYNIGDGGISIPSSAGATVVTATTNCNTSKCCWNGNTAVSCINKGSYSGCNRK